MKLLSLFSSKKDEKKCSVKTAENYQPLLSPYSIRFWICLLMTTGLFSTVSMRIDLSMAIVCMVNSTYSSQYSGENNNSSILTTSKCPNNYQDAAAAMKAGYNGDLLWTPSMQSMLFSSTFYGSIATTIFSGYIADRFKPKIILIVVVLDYVIITLLTPVLALWSYNAFFISRMVMGIGEGFMFPTIASLAGRWFAPTERSTASALFTSGNQISASVVSLISAELCASRWGWQSIFYLFGVVGFIWGCLWVVFGADSPQTHGCISDKERTYLEKHIPPRPKQHRQVPWTQIATSKPLIVAILCQFSYNLQASILQSFLPTYFKEALHLPLTQNGLYTIIPFVSQLISKNVLAVFADFLKRKGHIDHTTSAKSFQTICSIGCCLSLLALAFVPDCESPDSAIYIMILYGLFYGAGICGFFTSVMSIAPNLSGLMSSISMIFGVAGNITGPLLLSLLNYVAPAYKWQLLFLACVATVFVTGILFVIFGSAETQPWAIENEKEALPEDMERTKTEKYSISRK